MDKDDAGPAFPTQNAKMYFHGMTLRDYFAAKALPVVADNFPPTDLNLDWVAWVSRNAYAMADAMLKERDNG